MYRVRTAADSRLQRLVGPAARDDGGGPGLDFRSSRTGRGGGSGFPVQLSARGEGQVQGGDGVVEVMGLVAPMIGAHTAGLVSSQASAIWAGGTACSSATARTASRMSRSLSLSWDRRAACSSIARGVRGRPG